MLRKKIFVAVALLWLFEFALYARSIGFEFINFDDYFFLLGRPQLYNESSLLSSLSEILYKSLPREGPMILRDISWAIDSYLFGFGNPIGYHLGNVLLNSSNVALLFVFLCLIGWPYAYAFGISAFFGVLPIHVEPVCWIMGRKDLLVTFFMLTGLINHVLYLEANDSTKRRMHYLLSILLLVLALLSKVNALTFFLVLISLEVFYPFLKGTNSSNGTFDIRASVKTIVAKMLPHLLISVAIYFWYKGSSVSVAGAKGAMENVSLEHIKSLLLFTPLVVGLYTKLILIPKGYSIDYSWPSIHQPLTISHVVLSFAIAAIIILIVIAAFKKQKALLFYIVICVLLMLPYLNVLYIGVWIANRYIYFASFCILAFIAYIIKTTSLTGMTLTKVGMCILGTVFFVANVYQTWSYQQVWRDDYTLWLYETRLDNPSLMSFSALADCYIGMAKKESDQKAKAALFGQADTTIDRGFATFKNSTMRETTPHLFRLYFLKGVLTQARGEKLEAQLYWYQKAYDLRPKKETVVRKMAEINYRMALESQDLRRMKQLSEASLGFFEKYLALTIHKQRSMQNDLLILEEYAHKFPHLTEATNRIRRDFFEHGAL